MTGSVNYAYDSTLVIMNMHIPDPHNAERLRGGFNYIRDTIISKVMNDDGTARSRYTLGL